MEKKKNQKAFTVRLGHVLILTYVLVFFIGVSQGFARDDCSKIYPNPIIKFDHKDAAGRIYIPVTNWAVYPNEMFRQAPELPPCGANANSSRTWVDIYNADTNAKIYGFCVFNSNDGLTKIWFMPGAPKGRVYIILNDRACRKSYKSNIIPWGIQDNCARTYPNPIIKFDHKDAAGRIYIPVTNWAVYPNEMFRQAPELPPCIYNAVTNARIYGFCALNSNDGLTKIWFMPGAPKGRVYIIINDRACKKNYKSNIIAF
ncbi:MAG: hypothetical protein NT166_09435 [Candidatus Aminicenantes bacterium]|nr:hypothetical protein [Candidatus Aminicenantes bacterium]